MKLTEHFSLEEMTKSYLATRKGIDNTPSQEQIENLRALCENVLEPVRIHFGKPVTINSGYRSPKLNKAVGGAKNSSHLSGCASDTEIQGISNFELGEWIQHNLVFDQLIYEYCKKEDPSAGWVHVSFNRNGKNRKQVMIIN